MKLYAEEIGQRRLQELALPVGSGATLAFTPTELGEYSIRKLPVLVVRIGPDNRQQWVLMPFTKENIRQHRGHCYLVRGRKVEHIVYRGYGADLYEAMQNYECLDTSKPIQLMKAHEVFAAGCGGRTGKKSRISHRPTAQGEAGSLGFMIKTVRFDNSRLTCVCKSRKF